jgi:hypothetical protein
MRPHSQRRVLIQSQRMGRLTDAATYLDPLGSPLPSKPPSRQVAPPRALFHISSTLKIIEEHLGAFGKHVKNVWARFRAYGGTHLLIEAPETRDVSGFI